MRTPDALLRFWNRLQEPRVITAIQGGIYILLTVTGLLSFFIPPRIVENNIGIVLSNTWAAAILLGGVLGTASIVGAAWWLERVALIAIMPAEAMLLVTAISSPYAPGTRLLLIALALWAMLSTIQRAVRIRSYPYDPER